MSAGKGDKPRNCFSKQYKENFSKIKWRNTKKCDSCKSNIKVSFEVCPQCGKELN